MHLSNLLCYAVQLHNHARQWSELMQHPQRSSGSRAASQVSDPASGLGSSLQRSCCSGRQGKSMIESNNIPFCLVQGKGVLRLQRGHWTVWSDFYWFNDGSAHAELRPHRLAGLLRVPVESEQESKEARASTKLVTGHLDHQAATHLDGLGPSWRSTIAFESPLWG